MKLLLILFAIMGTVAVLILYSALVVASKADQEEWEREYGNNSDRHEREAEGDSTHPEVL